MYKPQKRFFLFVIFLVFFSFRVFAIEGPPSTLSLFPTSLDYVFQPNLNQSFQITIANNSDKIVKASISFKGQLGQYFSSDKDVITIGPNSKEHTTINFSLPENLETGRHTVSVIIKNLATSNEGVIPVTIYSPCKGKCAEVSIQLQNQSINKLKAGAGMLFEITIFNRGTEDLSVSQKINLLKNGRILAEFLTEKKFILQGQAEKLNLYWVPENPDLLELGEYTLSTETYYGAEVPLNTEKTFQITSDIFPESIKYSAQEGDNFFVVDTKIINQSGRQENVTLKASIYPKESFLQTQSQNLALAEAGPVNFTISQEPKIQTIVFRGTNFIKAGQYLLKLETSYGSLPNGFESANNKTKTQTQIINTSFFDFYVKPIGFIATEEAKQAHTPPLAILGGLFLIFVIIASIFGGELIIHKWILKENLWHEQHRWKMKNW
jgi:hypothetical protein